MSSGKKVFYLVLIILLLGVGVYVWFIRDDTPPDTIQSIIDKDDAKLVTNYFSKHKDEIDKPVIVKVMNTDTKKEEDKESGVPVIFAVYPTPRPNSLQALKTLGAKMSADMELTGEVVGKNDKGRKLKDYVNERLSKSEANADLKKKWEEVLKILESN